MSDTEQNDPTEDPMAVDQTIASADEPLPTPEGRLTSYAPGHGPDGPVEIAEEPAVNDQKAADLAAIERVMVILHWIAGLIEEGKLSP